MKNISIRSIKSAINDQNDLVAFAKKMAIKVNNGEVGFEDALPEIQEELHCNVNYAAKCLEAWCDQYDKTGRYTKGPNYNGLTMTNSRKTIDSGLLDRAEEMKDHIGSCHSFTIIDGNDVEYEFNRIDDKTWSCYSVDFYNAAYNKFGFEEGVAYSFSDIEGMFGGWVDAHDDYLEMDEDGFRFEFQAQDEPEDEYDDEFEHDDYVCNGIYYDDERWYEDQKFTTQQMWEIVDRIENGNDSDYNIRIDDNITADDVL